MTRSRILLFCHDGTGLGHLRRISRLAAALQERFSTLVLSGMREAAWIVPRGCGLVTLPDWDGIDSWRATRAGRSPWIDLTRPEAARFRAEAIDKMAKLFEPHVVIVDYLPFGQRGELEGLFASCSAVKYFLHRGLSDTSDSNVLRGPATRAIAESYDRILVASDPRLVDIAAEDDYCEEAKIKVSYVGLIAPETKPRPRDWSPTVVCSGGGGHRAEALMQACIEVARGEPQIPFKVILGPRSRLARSSLSPPTNCDVSETRQDLPDIHRNAAVVISSGGYNSVLEAASGGARLIIYPSQTGDDDEQLRFADRLSRYHPVLRLERLDALGDALRRSWSEAFGRSPLALPLRTGGAERIRELVTEDLALREQQPGRANMTRFRSTGS